MGFFKNLLNSVTPKAVPQPALTPAMAQTLIPMLMPTKSGIYIDPSLQEKPSLGTRILKGLPGAAAQMATIWGAKSLTTALISSVSPLALAPIITGAATIGAGMAVAQSFKYARERMDTLSKEQGRTIDLKTVFKEATFAGAKREAAAFGKEIISKNFWKKAANNGKWSVAIGAALGVGGHTELGQDVVDFAKEKAQSAFSLVNSFNPFAKLTGFFSGPAPVRIETGPGKVAKHILSAGSAPEPAPALTDIQETVASKPLTLLEELKYLLDSHGIDNPKITQLLQQAEAGNAQSVKDLAMGLNNGKLGLPLDRAVARELYELAAGNGNTQAIRDLAILNGTAPVIDTAMDTASDTLAAVPAPVIPDEALLNQPLDIPAEADLPPADLPAESEPILEATPAPQEVEPVIANNEAYNNDLYSIDADNEADVVITPIAFNDVAQPDVIPAEKVPANFGVVPAEPPARLGDEAARCLASATADQDKIVANSHCAIFKEVVGKNDYVLAQSADGSVSERYTYDGDDIVPTADFTNDAIINFADKKLAPAFE